MTNNTLDVIATGISEQYDQLNLNISEDIVEDIKEAERANFNQCYKSSVVMCRRALQLGLMDNGIKERPLGKMIKSAFNKGILKRDTYNLAKSIKHFGDIGAHRKEHLDPQKIGLVIYMTIEMLNELYAEKHVVK